MKQKQNEEYSARFKKIFRKKLEDVVPTQLLAGPAPDETSADRGETAEDARPTLRLPGGAGLLLTAKQIVHDVLALQEIRDPARWLKRHGAPVALDIGHAKRYLASDTLEWAAEQFAPDEKSKEALRHLANALRMTLGIPGFEVRVTNPKDAK